ncbi:hypothetical protein MW887_008102 [Aspergillus wentii]|nr:hypothetical protein MW887_008102 [Aspergillus wentii]
MSRRLNLNTFVSSLSQSTYSLPVSRQFLQSPSFNFINPRHHVIATDKVTQIIPESAISNLNDENVLSLFTRGFFGGFVFAFERTVLRMGGYRLLPAGYTKFKPNPSDTIWNKSNIPTAHLLPVGSKLFGSFQLLDKHISPGGTKSYVDYGFGSDEFHFAGCHRFQIRRLPASKEVQIELHHFRVNPQKNETLWVEYIEWFHHAYAKALFADGMRSLQSV